MRAANIAQFANVAARATAGGGVPAWTPAELFAASEAGVWYDPSDLSTVWQDTVGGTAGAVNSVVGAIEDKSVNGNNATQSTTAAKPILRQTAGGLYYLEFDGVNDSMAFTNPLLGTVAHSVFWALEGKSATKSANDIIFSFGISTDGAARFFTNELALRVSGGNVLYDAGIGNNDKVTVSHIIPANPNVTDNRCWRNGTELGVTSSAAKVMNTGAGARIGLGSINQFWQMHFYGGIVVAADKSADRTDAEAYLNGKIGL